MDYTADSRQQKFRDRLKESGKKQRTFFLSDAAMDAIKKCKEETQSPSLNHALEVLLTTPPIREKSSPIPERQLAILDAANRLGEVWRRLAKTPHTYPLRKSLVDELNRVADEITALTAPEESPQPLR